MQILNVNAIIVGKFAHGFFVTVVLMAAVKMINETVPVVLLGKYGAVSNFFGAMGYLLCLGMGVGLPAHDYNPELVDDKINLVAKQADIDD